MVTSAEIKRLAREAQKQIELFDAWLINLKEVKKILQAVHSFDSNISAKKTQKSEATAYSKFWSILHQAGTNKT
jgi:hypothetical protein